MNAKVFPGYFSEVGFESSDDFTLDLYLMFFNQTVAPLWFMLVVNTSRINLLVISVLCL